jgi:predicted metal-dependent hydrolase
MNETLQIENLQFAVVRTPSRKTLGITVERNGELTLRTPETCSETLMEQFAREKLLWVYTKLEEKQLLQQSFRQREYVNGEGFYYLGRSYRLMIVNSEVNTPMLRLHRGYFILQDAGLTVAKRHFIHWFLNHAKTWLWERTHLYTERLNVAVSSLNVRDLGYRWGSCGPNAAINFHWRTILLPPPIIDYILIHELAHLREPHHGKAFWTLLNRTLPDWPQRKRWLAENGASYNL